MGRFLIIMKIAFKQIAAGLPIILFMYVAFPAGLAFFMGGVFNTQKGTEVEKIKIMIEDEDATVASKNLASIFTEEEMIEYIKIEDSQKSHIIRIPKGYEEALKSNSDITLEVEENQGQGSTWGVVKEIIDTYHKKIELEEVGISEKEINLLTSGTSTKMVENEVKANKNDMGAVAAGFIVMILVLIVANYVQQRALKIIETVTLRVNSTPNSKYKLILYDLGLQGLIAFLSVGIYIGIFRFTGYGFTGNISIIVLMSVISILFAIILAMFIKVLTPRKLGVVVAMILTLVVMFSSFSNGVGSDFLKIISEFSPFAAINDMFVSYEIHGTFNVIQENIIKVLAAMGIMSVAIVTRVKFKKVVE
ncbi:MAG: ABC transporter permease [Sarcina sp.]